MGPAKLFSAVALSSLLITTTQASIEVVPTQPAVLPGYTAYGIYWNSAEDWTSAGLLVDLSQGTFYQDPFGGDGPPNPALISIFPTLEFDTYVGIIGDITGGLPGSATDLGVWEPFFTDQHINVSWFNTRTDDIGYIKIGNFTVTNDAIGTWRIQSAGVIYEGIIPEPATLALFSLAVPAMLRRR